MMLDENNNLVNMMPPASIDMGAYNNAPMAMPDPLALANQANVSAPAQVPPSAAQAPTPAGTQSLFDRLTSSDGLGAIGAMMLGMSNNPNLARIGAQGLQQAQARKQVNKTIEALRKMGMPEGQIQMLAQNPELLKVAVTQMYKSKYGNGDVPADLQKFNELTKGWSEADKTKAARVMYGLDPRAASSLSISPEMLFQRAYMSEGGKGAAQEEIEAAKTAAGRESGMRMFEYGLNNLEESLLGTTTGSIAGLFPAMTGNQQLADQAVAMMAPILKQTFRAAGEGVFTDKDQELLLQMIPSRGTNAEVIQQAVRNIQMLVEFKLKSGQDVDVEDLLSRFGLGSKSSTGSNQGTVQVDY